MSLAIAPIVAFYDYTLQPIPALSWLGAPISVLDIAGALRLALFLRQQREIFHKEHLAKMSLSTSARVINGRSEKDPVPVVLLERRGRVRDFATSLVMVFGGEAVVGALRIWLSLPVDLGSDFLRILPSLRHSGFPFSTAPWLGVQPTFFVSPGVPLLFLSTSALVDALSTVPELSLFTELPLSLLDALTRAILLCNFVPVLITTHTSLTVSTSPYMLLLTAFVSLEMYVKFLTC